ncbi:MAG: GDSL-type esterase/lipase family protein [Planctomycetota bacterium]|nr:GDSL-type esterase/lipase family protein [Planctomycetota bacterium]
MKSHAPRQSSWLLSALLCLAASTPSLAGNPSVASPPTEDYPWMSIANWHNIHQSFVAKAKEGKADVMFLGDSITEQWRNNAIWQKLYAPLNALNFGIGGDLTQNVLWRVLNGETENCKPKVVVLLIGTNNTGGNSAVEIAGGIKAIVEALRKNLPAAKILVLGILPRGPEAKTPLRDKIAAVNAATKKLADGKTVYYLDIGPKLLDKAGKLNGDVSPDALHLSEKGYQIWADAMAPLLAKLLAK